MANGHGHGSGHGAEPSGGLELVPDTSWDGLEVDASRIDVNLRLCVSFFETLDFEQLYSRTGIQVIRVGKTRNFRLAKDQRLPLFVELDLRNGPFAEVLDALLRHLEENGVFLHVPRAYRNEAATNRWLRHVTARLELSSNDLVIQAASPQQFADSLRQKLACLIKAPGVARVSLPAPVHACLEDSLRGIALPADRLINNAPPPLDGNGVIVGIIDDGCALAHSHFLIPGTTQTRIEFLWDQTRTDTTGGWTTPVGFGGIQDFDGLELTRHAIDAAIGTAVDATSKVVDEDAVYAHLRYEVLTLETASHGTHVLDIAAGNGCSMMGTEGVARAADIIFVQLPAGLLQQGGPLLEDHIFSGVSYIFARAKSRNKPAVVNISYGGYCGPHDGSFPLASGIDELLEEEADRAVVVAAGNGFEADCHAMGDLRNQGDAAPPLRWTVHPEDTTTNSVEIWYQREARLELTLTPPGAPAPLPPVAHGDSYLIKRAADQRDIGRIDHFATNTRNRLNCARIVLLPTVGEDAAALGAEADPAAPLSAPAPSGVWTIGLENVGKAAVKYHAWVERDDLGRRGRRDQQSRFDPDDADPRYTITDFATARYAVCVGAYNTATQEVCRYSACGPTQDERRNKPDVCAPAEEDAAGRGILCASSRRAQPTRMNGTSASAPHVTGVAALMFQYNRDKGGRPLTGEDIRARIVAGATAANPQPPGLTHHPHQEVDPTRLPGKRQTDVWADLIGAGKINVPETMKLLPK